MAPQEETDTKKNLLDQAEANAFLQESKREIAKAYPDMLERLAPDLGVAVDNIRYSTWELGTAIQEANVDIAALLARRQPTDGVSLGKIAGAITFRLARGRIVHFRDPANVPTTAFLIQDLAALVLSAERVLRAGVHEKDLLEVAYQTARRHANQETLGLCFDVIVRDS